MFTLSNIWQASLLLICWPALLLDILESLSFPKTMRWADYDFRFVRPYPLAGRTFWRKKLFPLRSPALSPVNIPWGTVLCSNPSKTQSEQKDF